MSFWDTLTSLGETVGDSTVGAGIRENVAEDLEQLEADGLMGAPRFVGRQVGNVGQIAGNIMGIPVGAAFKALPQGAQQTIVQGIQAAKAGAMEVPAVASAVQYLKENPALARDAEALLGATELLAFGQIPKTINRAGGTSLTTDLPDFYNSSAALQAKGAAPKVRGSVFEALTTPFSPKKLRTEKDWGVGQKRIDELAMDRPEYTFNSANAQASKAMDHQLGKAGTLSQEMPLALQMTPEVVPYSNTQAVRRVLNAGDDMVPDDVLSAAQESMKRLGDKGRMEGAVGRVTNPTGDKPPLVFRHDITAPHSKLHAEITGNTGAYSPMFTKGMRSGAFDRFKAAKGGTLGEEGWREWAGISTVLGRGAMKRADLPRNKSGKAYAPGDILKGYLDVLEKGPKAGKAAQAKAVWLKKRMAETKPNLAVQENGLMRYGESWISQDKALGGVGGRYFIDPKTDKVYGMVMDGHDLKGANLSGAHAGYTVTPVVAVPTSVGKTVKPKRSAEALKFDEDNMRRMERRTGVKIEKGDDPYRYSKQVAKEYRARPRLQDQAQAGYHGLLTGQALLPDQASGDEQ